MWPIKGLFGCSNIINYYCPWAEWYHDEKRVKFLRPTREISHKNSFLLRLNFLPTTELLNQISKAIHNLMHIKRVSRMTGDWVIRAVQWTRGCKRKERTDLERKTCIGSHATNLAQCDNRDGNKLLRWKFRKTANLTALSIRITESNGLYGDLFLLDTRSRLTSSKSANSKAAAVVDCFGSFEVSKASTLWTFCVWFVGFRCNGQQ